MNLGELIVMRNSKSRVVGFLAYSVLQFSTDIDVFINTPKNEFLHFLIDSIRQCFPVKANICKFFIHGI